MKIHVFIFLLFGLTIKGISQQPTMCMPPFNIPISASGLGTVTSIPGTWTTPYAGGNSAYDKFGNLQFFVIDDGIYDAAGNFLSNLTTTYHSFDPTDIQKYRPLRDCEIAIVPVPKACNRYYVIHPITHASCSLIDCIVYEMVDCSGPTPVVYKSDDEYTINPYVIFAHAGDFSNGIAVRKSNVNGNYYLYTVGRGLYKYDITPNGINNQVLLSSLSSGFYVDDWSFSTQELEVSPDGKWLAWAPKTINTTDNGKIFKFELTDPNNVTDVGNLANTTPTIISITPQHIYNKIVGLEFAANNDLFVSADMYNAADRGLYKNIHGTTTLNFIPGTANYISHLERKLDDKIYMINFNNGQFAYMDPSSLVITTIPLATMKAYSNDYSGVNNSCYYYKLPDQIDGEDYSQIFNHEDLIIRDEPLDNGIEPTATGLNIWEGDIWNCNYNTSCVSNQHPQSASTNYMLAKVTNMGCVASNPAELHMYWTRARTGEYWKEHWLDPSISPSNVIGGHPAGGEITVTGVSTPNPILIPSLAPGASIILDKSWSVPNSAWYPLIPGVDDGVHPMICFLGRVVSATDPINYEPAMSIYISNYVRNNNNVATRNSWIYPFTPFVSTIKDGSILVNNPRTETEAIQGIRITGLNLVDNISYVESIDIEMEPTLYDRWLANGRYGTGIRDMGHNVIRIVDYNLAEIANVDIRPGEAFNIVPIVTVNDLSSLKEPTHLHSFMINHYFRNGRTNSAGVYHVEYTNETDEDVDAGGVFGEDGRPRERRMKLDIDKTSAYLNDSKVIELILDNNWQNDIQISFYNINGALIKNQAMMVPDNHLLNLDTKDIPKGMYVLKLFNKNTNQSLKINID